MLALVQVTSGRINTREQIGCACLTLIDPSGKSLPLAATQSLLAWCSARNRSRALRMVAPHWLADGRCVPPNWRAPQVEALVYLAGNSLHLYVRFAPNAASFTCLARFHAHAPYEPHARLQNWRSGGFQAVRAQPADHPVVLRRNATEETIHADATELDAITADSAASSQRF